MLYVSWMRPKDAFLGLMLGLRGILDIWIRIVAWPIPRHAWIPPQRTALAGRRGQTDYVLDHCQVVLCFQEGLAGAVSVVVFSLGAMRLRVCFESCLYKGVI